MSRSIVARLLLSILLVTSFGCRSAESKGGEQPGASAPPASAPATSTSAGDVASATGDTSGVLARADQSRIQGDPKASVWLVVVSDFQCPYCKTWHDETYPALVKEYVKTGKIRMAYVHLPLKMHPHAMPAAEASLCAGLQGKFWEMQDAIFTTQQSWAALPAGPRVFDAQAAQVGVGNAAYQQCMAKGTTRPLAQADYDRVTRAGVQSTPTFLVGDQSIAGAQPIAIFREVLDRALAASAAAGR